MVHKSNSNIRTATASDIPYILDMYKKGLVEMGVEDIKDSHLLNKVVTSFHQAPCFLLEISGIIRGIAGLTVTTSPWSGGATLSDYIFYIEPEYRSLNRLNGLVNSCKKFAKERELPLMVNFIVNDDENIRIRLLKMNGFKLSSVMGRYND